jgi:hypothetical protein
MTKVTTAELETFFKATWEAVKEGRRDPNFGNEIVRPFEEMLEKNRWLLNWVKAGFLTATMRGIEAGGDPSCGPASTFTIGFAFGREFERGKQSVDELEKMFNETPPKQKRATGVSTRKRRQ